MITIGYHCSHERFKPSELLRYIQLAEQAGFSGGMCSEHFLPWSEQQGQSGFTWAWLGAALQATDLSFGMVTAPGQRYNPAITAQAIATLAEMFPGRVWCAFGSGQFLNEHITGEGWPVKSERQARLKEAVDVIRALWAGETVTHRGHFTVDDAKLYTLPKISPLILGAAITSETAEWVATWADGVITVAKSHEDQKKFIESFRRGGGGEKPLYLQVLLSYDKDEQAAVQGAWENWRSIVFGNEIQADLKMPSHFDAVAQFVRPEDMYSSVRISSDLDQHIDWLREDIELGFERIYLHTAMRDQEKFIEDFGKHVLPALITN
jgi:coenzyme F420-dependent glucose-6-phosphate dehydrogenase